MKIDVVENNIYIPKESKKFIRDNEIKMESEFFKLYNLKNVEELVDDVENTEDDNEKTEEEDEKTEVRE